MSIGKRIVVGSLFFAAMAGILVWSGNGWLFGGAPQKVIDWVSDAWNHRPTGYSQAAGKPGPGLDLQGADMAALANQAASVPVVLEPAGNYDVDAFGDGWASIGGGCTIRDQVLDRDLTDVTYSDGSRCQVATGTLVDPYRGFTVDFTRGQATSAAVQIDHVVPRAVAWRTGANAWTDDQRETFSNDTLNLLAVDGPSNGAKSDKTLAEFANATAKDGGPALAEQGRCDYAARYVSVVVKYGLGMYQADKDYAVSTLTGCAA
ncbi:HNH endonuclease family protein [Cellulosimicrobium sp. Marseille-Q4280]|uniref:HNH endonuclease family protein n=1 Tax=Cellulosimicrobium sp. Marseille-Q4280 TaxID=2937992 RepID=UPI0020406CE6|nr:HNH endonuclease family protein [Cellulosimicrobium sp. Marseille-Q4280]